jgi:hypothetical protein
MAVFRTVKTIGAGPNDALGAVETFSPLMVQLIARPPPAPFVDYRGAQSTMKPTVAKQPQQQKPKTVVAPNPNQNNPKQTNSPRPIDQRENNYPRVTFVPQNHKGARSGSPNRC